MHGALHGNHNMYIVNYMVQTAQRENYCSVRVLFLSNSCPPDRKGDKKSVCIFFQQLKGDHTSKNVLRLSTKVCKILIHHWKPLVRKWQCSKYLQQPPFNVQAVFGWNFQHSHKTHCHE